MRNSIFTAAVLAASVVLSCSCARFEQGDGALSHTVAFEALSTGSGLTKTTVSEGATAALFYWEDSDKDRLSVCENGVEAESFTLQLSSDKRKAVITAEFANSHETSFEYTATVNGSRVSGAPAVPSDQTASSAAYDSEADILIADTLRTDVSMTSEDLSLRFRRPVAISRMTLKGLESGEKVTAVTLSADKELSGTYDPAKGTFSSGSNTLSISCSETAPSSGEVSLLFVSVPVTSATFGIEVTTDKHSYSKTFAKAISLTSDAMTRFSVNLEGCELSDPHEGESGWFLVKNAAYLQSGDVIRLASNSKKYVASGWTSSYLTAQSGVTFSSDKEEMLTADGAMDITITNVDGNWKLNGAGYGVICGKRVKEVTIDDDTAILTSWPIAIDSDGNATVGNADGSAPGRFLYNSSSPRFQLYGSGTSTSATMSLPQIYKRYGSGSSGEERTKLVMGKVSCTDAGTTYLKFEWSSVANATGYAVSFDGGAETIITSTTWMAQGLSEGSQHTISVYALAGESDTYTDSDAVTCTAKTGTTSTETPGGGWFELPAMNDADGDGIDDSNKDLYYASHKFTMNSKEYRNYTVCFDSSAHCAAWVAAPRHSFYSTKNTTRKDSYKADPNIPSSIQYTSKSNASGCAFNRGHLLGSKDRLCSAEANAQVFYYTNIAPQYSSNFNLGGGAWNNLESVVDDLECSDTLYVVIGCYFDDFKDPDGNTCKAEKITYMGRSDVSKPTMFYYALIRTKSGNSGKSLKDCSSSEIQCAALVLSHDTAKGHKPDSDDLWSISELEALTGFSYFDNVPNAPKSTVTVSDWL